MNGQEFDSLQDYGEENLRRAVQRFEERTDEALPGSVAIRLCDDDGFLAFARPDAGQLQIDIAEGTIYRVAKAWEEALEFSKDLPEHHKLRPLGAVEHAIQTSFQWLLQHELNHYAIGHFDLVPGAGLAEGPSPNGLGIVSQRTQAKPLLNIPPQANWVDVHFCVELPSDHNASEIILGSYVAENWAFFKYYSACIRTAQCLKEKHL